MLGSTDQEDVSTLPFPPSFASGLLSPEKDFGQPHRKSIKWARKENDKDKNHDSKAHHDIPFKVASETIVF